MSENDFLIRYRHIPLVRRAASNMKQEFSCCTSRNFAFKWVLLHYIRVI